MNHSKSIIALFALAVLCSALSAGAQTSDSGMSGLAYWQARSTGRAVPASPAIMLSGDGSVVLPASYQDVGGDASSSPSDIASPLGVLPATPELMGDVVSPLSQGVPLSGPVFTAPMQGVPVRPRLLVSGKIEYLNWWLSGMDVPPLVTTSPATVPQIDAGVLGHPDTTILYGEKPINDDGQAGIRFSLGFSLNPCSPREILVDYFSIGRARETYSASDADYSVLTRPYFDIGTALIPPREAPGTVVYPGVSDGSISIAAVTEFQGLELLVRRSLIEDCGTSVDLFWGYRWLGLDDRLTINDSRVSQVQGFVGQKIDIMDDFLVDNNFHGGEVGLQLQKRLNSRWSVDFLGKVAVGGVHSEVAIDGAMTITDAGGAVNPTTPGGMYVLPSNMGVHEENNLATATELGFTLRRTFRPHLDVTIGYTFLYLSTVGRAGDQIDRDLNLSQANGGVLVGPARPEYDFVSSDFLAQGLSVGLEYDY